MKIEKSKTIHGNSIELLRSFPTNSVHAIISDIPYGISQDDWDVLHDNTNSALGKSSSAQEKAGKVFKRRGKPLNGWSNADKNIPNEYQSWCELWALDWLRILKPGGSCLIFAGRRYSHRCVVALENTGFTFKDMLAWEKPSAPHRAQRLSEIYRRRNDIANADKWQGWRVANLRPLFEPILWFQKPYKVGGTIADNVLEYEVGAWNDGIISDNILRFGYKNNERGLHETQKPEELMECLVSLVTTEGQVVLDPFAGSGTTCVAAKKLGRMFIGIELDEKHYGVLEKRVVDTNGD